LLEDMMSLGTDFEMHAIWQGCVEEPAAKDFAARKACTIALSKSSSNPTINHIQELKIPWGFLT
jgi:hypothetical protein